MTVAADRDVQGALTTSFIFHGVILLALLFGLPHMKPEPLEMVQPIAVDIVDVGPVTTTQVQSTGQVAKKNDVTPPPLPAPPKPAPKPVAAAPAAPLPKPVAVPKTDDKDAMNNLIKSESKKANVKPQPEKKTDTDQQFGSLLKNLSKQKPADTTATADVKTPPVAMAAAAGAAGITASHLTISEEDALRRQIEQCWYVPMGAKDAQNLIIEIHLEVNPDRTVKTAEIVNTDRMSDPFFRAAAESARRAILNPKCSPLNLPEDKADMWKSMTLRFNPQDVL